MHLPDESITEVDLRYIPELHNAGRLVKRLKAKPTWDEAHLALRALRSALRRKSGSPCNRRTHPGVIIREAVIHTRISTGD